MRQNRRAFLRNGALASGAISLRRFAQGVENAPNAEAPAEAAISKGADSKSVREQFQSPPKKYRPLARWWWPGNGVTDEELRREIGVLDEAGFGGAEIQPFIKGFDVKQFSESQRQRMESYATPSFFHHVATAAEEARKRGMFIDHTFGSGWPFGGGMAITPELAAIELRSTHISVDGPAKLQRRLPMPAVTDGDPSYGSEILDALPEGWAERMKKRTKLEAVVAVRGEDAQWYFNQGGGRAVRKTGRLQKDTPIVLTSYLQPDGTLMWDVPDGTWQIFVFSSVPTGQRVNAGAGGGPQLVMDHMNAEAFAAHAKRVGDDAIPILGEFFGDGMRAIFCDSLEVRANLFWSGDFLAEFRRRRGYDLTPYLPILKVQSHSEPLGEFFDVPVFEIERAGSEVRHDYRLTVSELMNERFYGQFNKWARDHKLLSRTQAHGAPTDVLQTYGEADIPETEDLFDNGGYDFLKMAASAAHVYGRSIVGSESFVWANAVYQTTPEKIKIATDELLTAGVNAIVYHGFPYIIPEIPPPGWHPFTGIMSGPYSSQCNELNPFWPYFVQLNSYITRMQYVSQSGRNVAAVALYRNDLAHGADEQPPTPKLNQALMDAGYNYDHINAGSLLNCTVHDGILTTRGGASYRGLVFPALGAIEAELAEKLAEFANARLPIIFAGEAPMRAEGMLENARNTRRLQAAMKRLRQSRTASFASDHQGALAVLRNTVKPNVRFYGAALPFIQKRLGRINAFFLRNRSDAMQKLNAEFEAKGAPELWDPWTGAIKAIADTRRNGNWVEVEVEMDPYASALIVFDPENNATHAVANAAPKGRALVRTEAIGVAGWKFTATGMVPSGITATIHRDLQMLLDWSLDDELRGFSGSGAYATAFTVDAADARRQLILDLGEVRDVAEIEVNGRKVATLLLRPYRADISKFIRSGENQLQVTVTNALFNSLVLRNPRLFRAGPTENASGLKSSGLIGPVRLQILD
jgi:hypothetical protein